MTESPIDPDKAAIARRLDRRELERAVLFKAAFWRAMRGQAGSDHELAAAVEALTAFDAAHPDVSPPARATAGPDPEALRPGAFPLCAPRNPATRLRAILQRLDLQIDEQALAEAEAFCAAHPHA